MRLPERVRRRQGFPVGQNHLALFDQVHQLDTPERSLGRAEGFELQHGPDDSLHSPMVLFHQIIQLELI